jgi:uncharacterized LabA/DUF88 family protein
MLSPGLLTYTILRVIDGYVKLNLLKAMSSVTSNKVSVYIDGFNLYFGLKAASWRKYYWLDMGALAARLLKPGQTLVATKYFTARTEGGLPLDSPSLAASRNRKQKRQATYLDALAGLGTIQIFEGYYSSHPKTCNHCGGSYYKSEEKKTDANIATEIVADGLLDVYDVAIVVSGDTDLVPPVQAIRTLKPGKIVISAFPPRRANKELRKVASGFTYISEAQLRQCQLPDPVITPAGVTLNRPTVWV